MFTTAQLVYLQIVANMFMKAQQVNLQRVANMFMKAQSQKQIGIQLSSQCFLIKATPGLNSMLSLCRQTFAIL